MKSAPLSPRRIRPLLLSPRFLFLLGALAPLGAAPVADKPEAPLPTTVVECSGLAETVSTDTETVATFHDDVVATGNGIRLTCDYLKVIALRKGDPAATLGKYGNFKSLIATGHVHIYQSDRQATCGRAEIFPGEDRIVLTEKPVVTGENPHYEASGPRMVLLRGQKRAIIEGTPNERTHITLPALKDISFHDAQEGKSPAGGPAPAPSPTGTAAPAPSPGNSPSSN
jgi:lipopolysaccharide export system protein LptA